MEFASIDTVYNGGLSMTPFTNATMAKATRANPYTTPNPRPNQIPDAMRRAIDKRSTLKPISQRGFDGGRGHASHNPRFAMDPDTIEPASAPYTEYFSSSSSSFDLFQSLGLNLSDTEIYRLVMFLLLVLIVGDLVSKVMK